MRWVNLSALFIGPLFLLFPNDIKARLSLITKARLGVLIQRIGSAEKGC